MIYLSNEPYPQEISVPRSFGVIVPQRNTYLSTADIATDLTTDSDQKVLAASQGVALKAMVDAKADASDVYTKTEVDAELALKADADDVYTKQEVDTALAGKQDELVAGDNITIEGNVISATGGGGGGDSYTRAETDALLAEKADADDVYTKSEVDTALAGKANANAVYTKSEVDAELADKQDVISDLQTIRSGAAAGATAVQPAELSAGLATKQDILESGVNIKTINNQSLLGSGNIDIQGGGGGTIDNEVTKDSTNAVKSSGIYSALGKYGVITQNINWTGDNTTGFEASTSDPVYGLIPQFFIDLVTAEGAVFNATTGYFELNGITDIAYDEMQEMYAKRTGEGQTWVGSIYCRLDYGARTCFPVFRGFGSGYDNHEPTTMHMKYAGVGVPGTTTHNSNLIIFALTDDLTLLYGANGNNFGNSFNNNYTLKKVLGVFNVQNGGLLFYPGANCPKLESFQMRGLKTNLNLSKMPSLDTASIAYMINYAGTAAITITLHATAYARAIADADVQAALAAHTNVSLASA